MFKSSQILLVLLLLAVTAISQIVIEVEVQQIAAGAVNGPESIAFDDEGLMYTTNADGRLIVLNRDGSNPVDYAQTGGRPLGLKFDSQGNLIVADAYKGLLSIDTTGEITVLTTEYDGVPFLITDDLDIASDGTIYFSDASFVYNLANYTKDYGQSNGRLLAYDPATKQTHLLLDDLFFANGVALAPDESYVLVSETWEKHITRYWLTGPHVGQEEIFSDLKGFGIGDLYPDNITYNGDSVFWVSTAFGAIAGLDTSGQIVYQLEFNYELVTHNSSTIQYNDTLYLGSFDDATIGITPLPEEIAHVGLESTRHPRLYFLKQNYPNPFNPTTTISYDIPEYSDVNLTIYDVTGREVTTLQNQEQAAGHYKVQWNGVAESGIQVNTGVYFARLQVGDFSKTIKMVYLK